MTTHTDTPSIYDHSSTSSSRAFLSFLFGVGALLCRILPCIRLLSIFLFPWTLAHAVMLSESLTLAALVLSQASGRDLDSGHICSSYWLSSLT